jgi:hypothetical protein
MTTHLPAEPSVLDHQELLAGALFERRAGSVILRLDPAWQVLSSAVLGGGRRHARAIIHVQVPLSYRSTRPERDLRSAARELSLHGPVIGLMTAVDLARTQIFAGQAEGGVAAPTQKRVPTRSLSRTPRVTMLRRITPSSRSTPSLAATSSIASASMRVRSRPTLRSPDQ